LKLISATLPEEMELLEFINILKDTNMQLSWCGTGMPDDLLVDIVMHHLENSRYKCAVEQLLILHTATGSSYNTLDALYGATLHLDRYRGHAYGSKHNSSSDNKCFSGGNLKGTSQGLVSAVSDQDTEDGNGTSTSNFTFHKDPWIGAVELEEKYVKHLHHIFWCPLCHTNKRNFPQCPILTCTFSITKLPVDDKKGLASSVATEDKDVSPPGNNVGQVSSVTLPVEDSSISGNIDDDIVDDFQSMVLWRSPLMDTNIDVSSYFDSVLLYPVGSARAVHATSSITSSSDFCPSDFSVIIDSGATAMIMPFHQCFVT
jgi:hypothetical protein